ncbi:uncharacterized protein LOC134715133 isoform X1 [Mytilus trossulus]|uniref:uncharacterized protein LOC134715133 isoform X1 n=1 Tax=Mytilus trossulus TaxID=6551 RepID=UPI003004D718
MTVSVRESRRICEMNETKQTRELKYDLPFGKASQTAKRFEVEELTPQPINGSPTDDLLYDQSASQDLFATQENIFVNRHIFSQTDSAQLGIKCGKMVSRESMNQKNPKDDTEGSISKKIIKKLPANLISLDNSDLPHPKHLFRKKRTKRLQAPKVNKKDLNDNLKNSVNGHIQQLRSKLAHRVTVNTSLAFEKDEKLSSKVNFFPEDQRLPLEYSNNENSDKSPFLKFDNEFLPHKSETWDELNVSLYQRWMTDVSYTEEE